MLVMCITNADWIDVTSGTLTPKTNPIKGKTYTVISQVLSQGMLFFILKELPLDCNNKPQAFHSASFEIIDGGIGNRAPKNNHKPNTPPIPPVIVGIPGT